MIDFYANKSKDKPRLIYRNFYKSIINKKLDKKEIINNFKLLIEDSKGSDFTRFVWSLPDYYKNIIDEDLEAKLNNILNSKKNENRKLNKLIFPHVSDEFSLRNSFLVNVFNSEKFPQLNKNDIFFTMGSCFASNFTKFLNSKKIKAINFNLTEDLNSPGSNASLLRCLTLEKNELEKYLEKNLKIFFNNERSKIKHIIDEKIFEIHNFNTVLKKSNNIIITLGNAIDYYHNFSGKKKLLPKFLTYSNNDLNKKTSSNQRLKNAGGTLEISNFLSIKKYIYDIYKYINIINRDLKIIFTLSPVPIDNVINIQSNIKFSAIEVDCISKSYLRSCFHEFFVDKKIINQNNCFYLPLYEVVRWIAPQLNLPLFGNEDASSRHVSNNILNSACDFVYYNCFSH